MSVAAAAAEPGVVELTAGDATDRLPDHPADRTSQGRAEGGTCNLQKQRSHQSITPGKAKAPARCRRHQGE